SFRRLWLCVFGSLRRLRAEYQPVARIQKRFGNLRQVVRSAAESNGKRHQCANRPRLGISRSQRDFERGNGCERRSTCWKRRGEIGELIWLHRSLHSPTL